MHFKTNQNLKKLNGRDKLEDLDVDGNITSKWILQQQDWHMWTVHLAQDKYQWWVLVNMLINHYAS
jgi:hypothetical protein